MPTSLRVHPVANADRAMARFSFGSGRGDRLSQRIRSASRATQTQALDLPDRSMFWGIAAKDTALNRQALAGD